MTTEEEQGKMTEQLMLLNSQLMEQSSLKYTFTRGIIYGVGFFIGSAIVATIVVGILSPWIGKIEWIRDNFERGASLR